jgi:DNA-binding NarL/FixJ family response regulator
MSITISNSFPSPSFTAANAASNVAAAPVVQQATTEPATDVVKLSEAQQVYQLSHQGQSAQQIATNLSLTLETVNSYLVVSQAK